MMFFSVVFLKEGGGGVRLAWGNVGLLGKLKVKGTCRKVLQKPFREDEGSTPSFWNFQPPISALGGGSGNHESKRKGK